MAKRIGRLYERICDYDNLNLAFLKAARGKRFRRDAASFRKDLPGNLSKIRVQLEKEEPDIGHYRFFTVLDPKQRSICAASFPERVLHHAVMNICDPILDGMLIHDSYACRTGKGSRKAVMRAKEFSGKWRWFLKLDIKKYFDSISHAVVISILEKKFKDRKLLNLFGKILDTYCTKQGRGLPIGNLISQHLANLYLNGLDRYIKENLKFKGYLRYMDDFLLFEDSRSLLEKRCEQIEEFLEVQLALQLKESRLVDRCKRGIPFLGYCVFPHKIALTGESERRFVRKFNACETNFRDGRWSQARLVRHTEPLIDFIRFADTDSFRTDLLSRQGLHPE